MSILAILIGFLASAALLTAYLMSVGRINMWFETDTSWFRLGVLISYICVAFVIFLGVGALVWLQVTAIVRADKLDGWSGLITIATILVMFFASNVISYRLGQSVRVDVKDFVVLKPKGWR